MFDVSSSSIVRKERVRTVLTLSQIHCCAGLVFFILLHFIYPFPLVLDVRSYGRENLGANPLDPHLRGGSRINLRNVFFHFYAIISCHKNRAPESLATPLHALYIYIYVYIYLCIYLLLFLKITCPFSIYLIFQSFVKTPGTRSRCTAKYPCPVKKTFPGLQDAV